MGRGPCAMSLYWTLSVVSPLILDEIILWLEIAVVLGLALAVVFLILRR